MTWPRGRVPTTVIDLFCGAGGLSLGFQAAGCRILAAADVDRSASLTYRTNFDRLQPDSKPEVLGATAQQGDLTTLDLERLVQRTGRPEVLLGAPPCQGFSTLGRAKLNSLVSGGFVADPRNTLYRRFLDAVRVWQPLVMVMENVPGMLSVGGRNLACEIARLVVDLGYRAKYAVLNAVWYGVPQFRERLIFVAVREDLGREPSFPPATHRATVPAGYAQSIKSKFLLPFEEQYEVAIDLTRARCEATTVAEAIGDLPAIIPGSGNRLSAACRRQPRPQRLLDDRRSRSAYLELMMNWPGLGFTQEVTRHVARDTPRDHEIFRRMQPGDRYPEAFAIASKRFEEELRTRNDPSLELGSAAYMALKKKFVPPYPEDVFPDKWRKLYANRPSWTLPAHLAKDSYSHIHYDDEQARSISIREAARLQSFPDGFLFNGNMGDCYRQIGNAVPPLMSWAIASCVLECVGMAATSPHVLP